MAGNMNNTSAASDERTLGQSVIHWTWVIAAWLVATFLVVGFIVRTALTMAR